MVEIYEIPIILEKEIKIKKKETKKHIQLRQETEEELRLSYDNETYTEDYYEDQQYYYIKKSCNNLMRNFE